jgi:cell division protease FtsH
VEEAKEDVKELVDFLSEPDKFTRVGGKIPTFIYLYLLPPL